MKPENKIKRYVNMANNADNVVDKQWALHKLAILKKQTKINYKIENKNNI